MNWRSTVRTIRTRLADRPAPEPPSASQNPGARTCFSVHGEELILNELLWRSGRNVERGFYVDIGAYHPWNASNTASLYLDGWRGIVVEPNPYMAEEFRRERPEDIIIEAAVTTSNGTGTLYSFGDWASSNSLDRSWVQSVIDTQHVSVEQEIEVPTATMEHLLDKWLPENTQIDFLNVDVEGLDEAVLRSNNWNRYLPSVIAVEEYSMSLLDPQASPIMNLLEPLGYRLVSRAVLTNFYILDIAR